MNAIKYTILVCIDRSGYGKAFLVCKATSRRNIPAECVSLDVEIRTAK